MNSPEIRIAMVGMVEGNGHPYSWSSIINGKYDEKILAECGFPAIVQYLAANREKLGVPGAKVTHVWAENSKDAEKVAKACFVENVVERGEDVIGKVDAVCIPTDVGSQHVARARPFIEAGVPVFIDNPLADNREDLQTFIDWNRQGKLFMSASFMRYADEIAELQKASVGRLFLATGMSCQTWSRYAIHALEGLYQLTGPGFVSVRDVGQMNRHTVLLKHITGAEAVLWSYFDCYGGYGTFQVIGDQGSDWNKFSDTFLALKHQMEAFVEFAKTKNHPFPPEETNELIAILIAAQMSLEQNGKEVPLTDIIPEEDLP